MPDLPLFPLNTVLFPTAPLTLHIFEERYKEMISRCIAEDIPFGVVLIREGSEVGAPAVPFEVGTSAQIVRVEKLLQGRLNLVAVGRKRFRLLDTNRSRPYLSGRVEFMPQPLGDAADVQSAAASVRRLFGDYLGVVAKLMDAEVNARALPDDALNLAYTVAATLQVDNDLKQAWLSAESIHAILQSQADLLPKELARLKLLARVEGERKADDDQMGSFSRN
jgi:uncharacterized protein